MVQMRAYESDDFELTGGFFHRAFGSRYALIIIPLVLITAFCFFYLSYSKLNGSAEDSADKTDTSEQTKAASTINALPLGSAQPIQAAPTVTTPPSQTITSTSASDETTGTVNPGEATTTPLQSNTTTENTPGEAPVTSLQRNVPSSHAKQYQQPIVPGLVNNISKATSAASSGVNALISSLPL